MPADIWSSQLRSGSAHWDLELAVEVRQCPLRSEVRQCPLRSEVRLRSGSAHWDLRSAWGPAVPTEIWGPAVPTEIWGPAVPTEIWSSQLRSGSAHCDLEFAVEVRKCERDLQFTVGGRRKEKGWRRRRKEEGRRKEEVTLIKSRDPVFFYVFYVCLFSCGVLYIYIFIYIYIYVLLFYHVLAVFFNPCLFKCVYFIVLKTIRNRLLFWMLEYIYIYIIKYLYTHICTCIYI